MAKNGLLRIGLFDPGMTHIHRVGLAGLYITLQSIDQMGGKNQGLRFELSPTAVTLKWQEKAEEHFDALFQTAFGITETHPKGLLDFAPHRVLGVGNLVKLELHQAVLDSFLQHNKQNKIPKGTPRKSLIERLEDRQIIMEFRPLMKPYAHTGAAKYLVDKRGRLKKTIVIKNWLYPGAAERHIALGGTELEEPPERFICLLFAPVGSLYFRISRKGRDGKFDERHTTAVCFPHIFDLQQYSRSYTRYLQAPVGQIYANGLGDAGLTAIIILKAEESTATLGVSGCTVVTMGKLPWSQQQRTRTGAFSLESLPETVFNIFEVAIRYLPNRVIVKDIETSNAQGGLGRYFVSTSACRGLVGDNVARGLEWFRGFAQLMSSSQLAKLVNYERGGLANMIEAVSWPMETDKKFIEAVHHAIRNRYGALAAQAKQRGEIVRFDKEFERIRTGLMRSKNAETLRSELADFFARGGINKVLQNEWRDILRLFASQDWHRTRDLTLLALASYKGKGADEIRTEDIEVSEEDIEP